MPLSILYVNQANERTNDDNVLYSIDAKIPIARGLLLAAELLVDDIQYERGDDAGPDRLAYSVRLEGRRLLAGRELGLAGRYTRVDIYTYEHSRTRSGANTSYVAGDGNYALDPLLGSSIGPDSDRWEASIFCGLTERLDVELSASFLRRGEGSDFEAWEEGKDRNPPFPSGAVEKESRFSAVASFDLGGGSGISATFGVRSIDGGRSSVDRRDCFGNLEIILDL